MIESTFIHIPGIGYQTEDRLWKNGITTWARLEECLTNGISINDLIRSNRRFQPSLFPEDRSEPREGRSIEWLQILELSRASLLNRDYSFLLENLDPRDHWRLLTTTWRDALYLDIETTGLSREIHYPTVIGAYQEGAIYQWSWPETLSQLFDLIRRSPLVVTFNGRRFDIPFLTHHFDGFPSPSAHIDLLDVSRAAGQSGGQKDIESHFNLTRPESLDDIQGEEAVQLWTRSLYGDPESYQKLLAYNRTDVKMLPLLADRLCKQLLAKTLSASMPPQQKVDAQSHIARSAHSFDAIQANWAQRRPAAEQLLSSFKSRFGGNPRVVGIDLRGNPQNPTGWALCCAQVVETRILFEDDEIVSATLEADPSVISIDAPLCLPRGRLAVGDDSPCRKAGGIVREIERVLWSRGISAYPALIKHMQGLTQRGMRLAQHFRNLGYTTIESYPGAAQDLLGIARKGRDTSLLQKGLEAFGFSLRSRLTHDELDAITSALVGYYFLADDYEAIGAEDEGYMIVPHIQDKMRWSINLA